MTTGFALLYAYGPLAIFAAGFMAGAITISTVKFLLEAAK